MVTRIDQDQLKVPPFDDTKGTGPTLETGAVDGSDSFNSVMSMLKNMLGKTNWYDAPDEDMATLAARAKLENKLILKRAQKIVDVSVVGTGTAQAFVVLGAGEYPSENIAINATTKGAVSAQLAGAVGVGAMTEVAGANALNPKNLCAIIDGTTGAPILDGADRVWGLLQVGNLATDGNPFQAAGNDRGQISFVKPNSTHDDLVLVDFNLMGGKTINYSYIFRDDLNSMSEQAFLPETLFADPTAGVVSLDSAYDGGSVVNVDNTDVDWRLTDTKEFIVSDQAGTTKILRVRALATGDIVELNVAGGLDINGDTDGGTFKATFNGVEIGGALGQVLRTGGNLILKTATSGDILLESVAEIRFTTSRETALPLDDATAGAISALPGGPHASISAAILHAINSGNVSVGVSVLGSNYGRDVNVPGGAGQSIASPHSIDMNTPSGVDTVIFLNGRLLYGGNASTNNDVYAGDTPANGDLKFDFPGGVKTGDVIVSLQW